MKRPFRAVFLYGFLLCVGGALWAAEEKDDKIIVQSGVPEGFEEFDGPQETAVDVFYGGLKIGSFRAAFTAQSVAFSTPEEIVNKIPSIKVESVKLVQAALSGDLVTNADKVCGPIPAPGCGVMQPEVAAIIFNESKFRAELFLHPNMLAEQDTHTDKILAAAPDVFSSNHGFSAGFTGSERVAEHYSLLANSTIAYGPGRMNVLGLVSDTHHAINGITAGLDRWGLETKAGFFESRGMQILPQASMAGISVGTSLNTNLILRDAAGSRLTIFLPQRGWVSLIHNGMIHATDFYEAGNQVLNTDSLPSGAYEITIRIRDMSGAESEEKRFFAKNFEIPPKEQGIYYVQAGTLRDVQPDEVFPHASQDWIGTLGTVQRLDDNLGFSAHMLGIQDEFYSELGFFLLLPPDHQLRISALASSVRDYGVGASYLGYGWNKRLAFALDARKIFAHRLTIAEQARLALNGADSADPISADTAQFGGSISSQITSRMTLALQGARGQTERDRKYAYGPSLGYDLWRDGDSTLSLTAAHNTTENGVIRNFFLRFAKRLGAWGFASDGSYSNAVPKTGRATIARAASGRVTWNDDRDPGRMTLVGADVRHDDSSDTIGADVDHRSSLGNLKLIASRTQTDGQGRQFYSGNIGFGVAQSEDGVAWGGNQQQASGIILNTTGNSTGIPMEVVVDTSKRGVFDTGSSLALFLAPYQTYNISIKPKDSTAVDYDGAVKRLTLYPGNIITLSWEVNHVFVVLGNVHLPDGSPLEHAKMEEARNITTTDETGMFQGEVMELGHFTFTRAADDGDPEAEVKQPRAALRCRANLPEVKEMNGVYIYSEPLICQPIAFDPEPVTPAVGSEPTTASTSPPPPATEAPAVTSPTQAVAAPVTSVESADPSTASTSHAITEIPANTGAASVWDDPEGMMVVVPESALGR